MGGFLTRLAPWQWDARARQRALVIVLMLAFLGALGWRQANGADARPPYRVPTNASMESRLGVRFTQAAVVADGGLVEVRYVVLDTQKATRFQSDTKHPPLLRSERRSGIAWRAALMRQGHELRPGQTYFLLYLNNHNAIRAGETLTIDDGSNRLTDVPVR